MLKITDIGKSYKKYNSQFSRFLELITGGYWKRHEQNWVINDINFEVEKGQSVGIIGRNGAGKSTLLKIITGTTKATNGCVKCEGRIAAILELGMGFDQDLSGRQNAIMGLHLLGLNGDEINLKISEIASFSELNEYFDLPIRIYSSGMLVRLAFSIATSSNPDLLIVDEALSVGDAYFQQKCTYVIENYKKNGGTLLFVSHDPNTVKSICDSAILLEGGRLVMSGSPKDVIDFYQSKILALADRSADKVEFSSSKENKSLLSGTSVTSNGDAELLNFQLLDKARNAVSYIDSDDLLVINYVVKLNKYFERPAFGLIIRDKLGRSIYETTTYGQRLPVQHFECDSVVTVKFELNFNLFPGQYSFSIGVANKGFAKSEFEEYSLLVQDVAIIQVLESSTHGFYGGVFNMKPLINITAGEHNL